MEKTQNELLDFLAKDEEEAIKGYEDVIAQLGEDNPLSKQLKKILDEERAHHNFLEAAKENPDLEYVDPSDNEDKDEVEEASKLFGMKLKGE